MEGGCQGFALQLAGPDTRKWKLTRCWKRGDGIEEERGIHGIVLLRA